MTVIDKTGASEAEFRARIAPFREATVSFHHQIGDVRPDTGEMWDGAEWTPPFPLASPAPAPYDEGTGMGEGVQ